VREKLKVRVILYSILGAGLLYLLFAAVIFAFQSRLIYFPAKELDASPHDLGLRYEAITVTASDGVELFGWFVPAQEERAVVLYCHGNAGNISSRLWTIQLYNKLHLSTFIFDYRGFGHSGGSPSEEGTHADALAAWKYLVDVRKIPPERIVVAGESLGGAVAARLAAECRPGALILSSTFTSLQEVASELYPFLPIKWMLRFRYPTSAYLRSVKCPVLIVHSREDELIPYSHGRDLYAQAPAPKELLEIKGGHNTNGVVSADACMVGIGEFVAKYLPQGSQ
jgi:fermentation-respiration switch protein FrsA (DUF1100 family)